MYFKQGMRQLNKNINSKNKLKDILSSKDKFKFIFDKITDLITLCDSDFTIIESNHTANIIHGIGESIVGSKCYKVFRNQTKPCIDCPLKDTLKSGSIIPSVNYDERFGEFFEERTYPIISDSGKFDGFILISKNVTKTRELIDKSAQIKKLSALGQISSGVAHDFNNVLTVVLGRVQLMKRQTADQYLINSLDMIEKSALDGASKVRKIQEFARPKKGKLIETIDLKSLIEEVVEITRPKWCDASRIKGILIEPSLELTKDLYIMGDSSDLRNAFTNLIFNAADAMPDGGVLSIKTKKESNTAIVEFKDTGIGMTEETVEKIFDPFFSTKGVLGTGLGMSEVYGIVKRHNGRINVKSKVGIGTTITLSFASVKRTNNNIAYAKPTETLPCRILVVDDEEYILSILHDLLTDQGHTVTTMSSAVEALNDFKENNYDIVITDLGMPEMSGQEIGGKIKKINSSTQVILISGWALNIDENKYLGKTVDFIIKKPFSIEKIVYTISEAVSKIKEIKKP